MDWIVHFAVGVMVGHYVIPDVISFFKRMHDDGRK